MKVLVKYLDKNGYDFDVVIARQCGLEKDHVYEMKDIRIGQSYSEIEIVGIKGRHNSVMFEFHDENMNEIDIFRTKYTPYWKGEDIE